MVKRRAGTSIRALGLKLGPTMIPIMLAGCVTATPHPATPAPAPAITSSEVKATPSLDTGLALRDTKLFIGGEFPLIVTATPHQQVGRISGRLQATGVISLIHTPNLVWIAAPANQDLMAQANFRINALGSGAIHAEFDVQNNTGVPLYKRATTLYFLVTTEEILTSTSGFQFLQLEHLDHLLAAGILTQAEYERAREQTLGGGARETNPTNTPAK